MGASPCCGDDLGKFTKGAAGRRIRKRDHGGQVQRGGPRHVLILGNESCYAWPGSTIQVANASFVDRHDR